MFISIVFLIVALIIIGTSALGIFLSRKSKALKNYTSKVPTIIFVVCYRSSHFLLMQQEPIMLMQSDIL